MIRKQTKADLTLLFVTIVWGAGFVLVQDSIKTIEPFTYNSLRFLAAAVFLWSWIARYRRGLLSQLNTHVIVAGIILGVWLHVAFSFQTFGLLYTSSSKAGFITGLNVILVPLLSVFYLKVTPNRGSLLGVAVAAIGLYLLTMVGEVTINPGDMLVLVCAVGFAVHIIITSEVTKIYSALLLTSIQLLTVAVLSMLSAFLFENWHVVLDRDIMFRQDILGSLLITSLFATTFAFLAQTHFQKYTSPTRVAVIYTMEPVFAAVAGVLFAGDQLSEKAWIGAGLIFIGMLLSELAGALEAVYRKWSKRHHRFEK